MSQKNNNKSTKTEKRILREKLEIILEALSETARVQALVKTSECLSFQQIENYVKNRYTREEFEKSFHHVASCHYCRRMVRKMRSVLEERTLEEIHEQKAKVVGGDTATAAKRPGSGVIGDLLKIVRGAAQTFAKLVFGENWQPVLIEAELGPETDEHEETPPSSQEYVLKLTSGSLEGAEVERTSDDRLIVTLNRPVSKGSYLTLLTETGEELQLPVVRPLDRRGRASYDLSKVSETPAFRIVLVEGKKEG